MAFPDGQARLRALATLGAVALVLVATLVPGDEALPRFSRCVICGELGLADGLANVLLFLPLGAALAGLGVLPKRALVLGVLLSAGVELLQAWVVPGRDSSLGDVLFNTLGLAGGLAVHRSAAWWARPPVAMARVLAAAALGAAALVVAGTGALSRPWLPLRPYWGQWTPRFGNLDWYGGRVVDARLGDLALPSRLLEDADAVRRGLRDGVPLTVTVRVGPPPRRLAPVFNIYDDRPSRILLLGVRGQDVIVQVRRAASRFALIEPEIRVAGALQGVAPGTVVRLAVRREGNGVCVAVGTGERCGYGVTPGRGWALLVGLWRAHGLAPWIDAAWILTLFAPVGYFSRGAGGWVVTGLGVGVVMGLLPAPAGLVAPPAAEWGAAAAGLLVGGVCQRVASRARGGAGLTA